MRTTNAETHPTMSQPHPFIEIAELLQVNSLDSTSLQLCAKLLDQGVDPVRLAQAIKKIQAQAKVT